MNAEAPLYDRNGSRKYLNIKERRRLYKAIQRLDDPGERCFVLTIFDTGCRISEALALTSANVDEPERMVVFRTLKQRGNMKYRAIHIPRDLLALLQQQAALRGPNERLFPFCRTTAWKIVKRCMADAGLEGIKATPKGLRHGYAIASAWQKTPVSMIQRWLGHENLRNTGIYLNFAGPEERNLAARVWRTSRIGVTRGFTAFVTSFHTIRRRLGRKAKETLKTRLPKR
jgi:integrase/recombinase XerD